MPKVPITTMGFHCERCGYEWAPRSAAEPRVCPKCKSPYWNRARTRGSQIRETAAGGGVLERPARAATHVENEFEEAKRYYERHAQELGAKYFGQYVAVSQGKVVAHGPTLLGVVNEAYDQVGYREVFVAQAGGPDDTVYLDSPEMS